MKPSLAMVANKIFSVEWNRNVAAVQHQLLPATTDFVFPDLPEIFSDNDRADFSDKTRPQQRVYTIATCHHASTESLLKSVSHIDPESKILLVSGNNSGSNTMSSIDAAKILQNEIENSLYGVANPNDPSSVELFEKKLQAGMSGFITQPLLSTHAIDTMQTYRDQATNDVAILAGLAFPKTVRGLRFWAKLLEQEQELENDALFQRHVAYFLQPNVKPIDWIEKELHDILDLSNTEGDSCTDGIHFMPLKNTNDLCSIFQSLNDES